MTISQTKLFELLNAQISPPVPFSASNVELINPIASAGASWNSRLTMRALAYKGYKNEASVFYTRVDLALLGTQEFQLSEIASAASLVAAINTRLNAWLDVSDLEPFSIPADEGTDESLTLTARAASLGWIGTMGVTLKAAGAQVPGEIWIDTVEIVGTGEGRYIEFTLWAGNTTHTGCSFDWATEDNTAVSGEDYTASSGTLTFAPGVEFASFQVPIRATEETDAEAFWVNFTNPVNCTLGNDYADGYIPEVIPPTPEFWIDEFDGDGTLLNHSPTEGTSLWHASDFAPEAALPVIESGALKFSGPESNKAAQVNVGNQGLAALFSVVTEFGGVLPATGQFWVGLAAAPELNVSATGAQARLDFALDTITVVGGSGEFEFDMPTGWRDLPAKKLELLMFDGDTIVNVALNGMTFGSYDMGGTPIGDLTFFNLFIATTDAFSLEINRMTIIPGGLPGPQVTISDAVFEELPSPPTMAWYASSPDGGGSWSALADSGSMEGAYPGRHFTGRLLDDPAGAIVWSREWIPVGGSPDAATLYSPDGPNPAAVETGDVNWAWGITVDPFPLSGTEHGELRLRATVDGVPVAGYLYLTFADGAQSYSDVAWGWSNEA